MQLLQILSGNADIIEKVKNMAIEYAPKLAGAIIVFIIGSWLIKKTGRIISKIMNARNYEPSLQSFLTSVFTVLMNVLLILTVIGMLGVNTTSFAALLAGAGIAIGAALNGTLGNLAGGVMMMVFKPFKVTDMIEAQGAVGIVKEMGIFSTTVLSPENKTIFLPNGPLSTGVITNYTTAGYLRTDLSMAIALDMDIEKARKVAIDAMLTHPKVLKTPGPEVSVLKVGDGMVTLAIRPYTTQPDYWDVYFGVQELVKNAWDKNGIDGPTPTQIQINK